jgi:hypothetical protein
MLDKPNSANGVSSYDSTGTGSLIHFFNRNVTPYATESSGPKFDLVISSGAIQYHPRPLGIFKDLLEINAPYIYIMSTTLADNSKNCVIIQKSLLAHNGPGKLPQHIRNKIISYPMTIINSSDFEAIATKNHEIIFKIKESKFMGTVNGEEIYFWSYLLKKIRE